MTCWILLLQLLPVIRIDCLRSISVKRIMTIVVLCPPCATGRKPCLSRGISTTLTLGLASNSARLTLGLASNSTAAKILGRRLSSEATTCSSHCRRRSVWQDDLLDTATSTTSSHSDRLLEVDICQEDHDDCGSLSALCHWTEAMFIKGNFDNAYAWACKQLCEAYAWACKQLYSSENFGKTSQQ